MSTPGSISGGSGGVDSPNYVNYNVADATQGAAANYATRSLHLVKDTLELNIAELGGKLDVYNARPGNPVLPPMITVRTSAFDLRGMDSSQVSGEFVKMLENLPEDLRTSLLKDMQKPLENRNPDMIGLEQGLIALAQTAVWSKDTQNFLNEAGKVAPTGGPAPGEDVPPAGFKAGMDPIAQSKQVAANAIHLLGGIEKTLSGVVNSLPEGDPNKVVLAEFLKTISAIITAAKEFLHEMIAADAKTDRAGTLAEKDTQLNKIKKMQENLQKNIEQREKQAEAKKKQETMRIVMAVLGPIIGIVMLAVTILTGGSMGALFIGVLSLALSMVDSISSAATGGDGLVSQGFAKMIEGVTKAIASIPGVSEETARIITYAIMAIVAVAVIVISYQVAMKVGVEVATKATKAIAVMTALGAGAQFIGTSGCVSGLVKSIIVASKSKMDDNTAEIIAMVMEMIVMLTMCLAGGAAGIKGAAEGVGKGLSKNMGNLVKALSVVDTAASIGGGLAQVGSGIQQGLYHLQLAKLAEEKGDNEAYIKQLETALDLFGMKRKNLEEGMKQMQETTNMLSDSFNQILQGMRNTVSQLTQA